MTAKILVVDDEPDVEDLVRQRFRRQIREGSIAFGFARDGEEALAFLAENPDFDTVVYGDARQSMTYHRGNGNLLSSSGDRSLKRAVTRRTLPVHSPQSCALRRNDWLSVRRRAL